MYVKQFLFNKMVHVEDSDFNLENDSKKNDKNSEKVVVKLKQFVVNNKNF